MENFDQSMAMFPPQNSGPPPRRNRNHRRAATEGNFAFLYQEKQTQSDDVFGLGPPAPAKPDLLNTMAHSFLKEEQQRLLNGNAGMQVEPEPVEVTPGPLLIHTDSQASSTVTPPSYPTDPIPVVSPTPPAMVFASEDEMMDLAMTVEPVEFPATSIQPIASNNNQTMTMTSIQPLDTTTGTTTMNTEGDEPSRLSKFLDSLQAVADQQNAMLRKQVHQQQQHSNKRQRHRRAVSEGPLTHMDWPSFEMSDRTEETAIFMANHEPAHTFY